MPNGNLEISDDDERIDYTLCSALDTAELRRARLLWARYLLRAGVTLFPLRQYSKRPAMLRWQQAALPTEQRLTQWVAQGLNLGALCGERSGGLHVIDFDESAEYAAWYAPRSALCATLEIETRRGMHLYYLLDAPMAHKRKMFRGDAHIGDVLTTGAYVVAPYSIHPSGALYTPRPRYYSDDGAAFIRRMPNVEALELPLPAPRQYAPAARGLTMSGSSSALHEARLEGIVARLSAAVEGERNAVLFWAACRAFDEGLTPAAVEALLLPCAVRIGLSEAEALRSLMSAERQERRGGLPPAAAVAPFSPLPTPPFSPPAARRKILTPQQRQAQRRRGR